MHGLVQVIITAVSSRVQQPCHTWKFEFPHHPLPSLQLLEYLNLPSVVVLSIEEGVLEINFHAFSSHWFSELLASYDSLLNHYNKKSFWLALAKAIFYEHTNNYLEGNLTGISCPSRKSTAVVALQRPMTSSVTSFGAGFTVPDMNSLLRSRSHIQSERSWSPL